MVAAGLEVDDDSVSFGRDDDAVGTFLKALGVHNGEFVENLKAMPEPGSHLGHFEDAGNGLLHLWLGNDGFVDSTTCVEIADDLGCFVGGTYLLHDGMYVVAFLLGCNIGFGWIVEDGEIGQAGRADNHTRKR